ncbi:unnamed protein product [Arctia plantaginis]|uniref:Uncharacterized protein n=1 Tax=Arctia plantaginis TaxID=874455 RepID=A0A8S0ZK87_ARCPL|nr:unnamed protein product [Arctia plantaginis]
MAESLFDIFGDHLTRQALKNVSRQPLSNIENMGKTLSSGPIKPNEPIKKSEGPKKSFLSNTGKALRNTPSRNVFTPRAVNVGSMIYSDETSVQGICAEEIEFHRPPNIYDNYHRDLFDYLPVPEPEIKQPSTPPKTPPPCTKRFSMEFNCSYQDEFFKDDFSVESIQDDDLGLPDLY